MEAMVEATAVKEVMVVWVVWEVMVVWVAWEEATVVWVAWEEATVAWVAWEVMVEATVVEEVVSAHPLGIVLFFEVIWKTILLVRLLLYIVMSVKEMYYLQNWQV
jgi:hypothetical protein